LCVGRSDKCIGDRIRAYLEARHYHKVFSEWRRSGGDSGALGVEIAQLDQYRPLDTSAQIQIYTVVDDSCNGFAEFVSVMLTHKHTDEVRAFIVFLEANDFVTNHKNLRSRPSGFKCFDPYLDEWYQSGKVRPFWHG
jgi:hypothetical protein